MRLVYVNQLKNNNMELVLKVEDLEPEPRGVEKLIKPKGLLNSKYKSLVKKNLKHTTSRSLFGRRQYLKRCQYQFTSSIGTVLKISAFALIFIVIYS